MLEKCIFEFNEGLILCLDKRNEGLVNHQKAVLSHSLNADSLLLSMKSAYHS